MKPEYELIQYEHGLNARILIHGVDQYKLHWHKELELLLVLRGRIVVRSEGQKRELGEDDLFFINSEEIHSTCGILGECANTIVVIQINPEFCTKNYPELYQHRFLWPNSTDASMTQFFRQMRFLIARIVEEYRKAETGYQLAIEGLLNTMMSLLVRNVLIRKRPQIQEMQEDASSRLRVQRISAYIQEHFAEKISLHDLADQVAYLNPYYLSHFFKDKMGISFHEYLNYVRLQNATALLSRPDKLITDIALQCGFAGAKAFDRVFKEHYGITPREYRKQQNFFVSLTEKSSYLEYDSLHALAKLQKYHDNDIESFRSADMHPADQTGMLILLRAD
jgi:xylan 1,4-beta-xylosidase